MKLKILLIEDDEDACKLLTGWLKALKCELEFREFARGDSAMEFLVTESNKRAAERFLPDLIILDLKLPDQHGLDLLKQLKSSPFKNIEVLVYTESQDPTHLRKAYWYGSCVFIRKSAEPQTLVDAVQNLITTGHIPAKY